jgi:methanogenic corrinoid protein MtbC1
MGNKKESQPRAVRLSAADLVRLDERARLEGCTQSELVREAVRWYLDNSDKLTNDARESEVAKAIRYAIEQHVKATRDGVERICKMLARQGIAVGTLYELTWLSLPDDDNARAAFEAAMNAAKQKMRKHVQKDEEEIAAAMKRVAEQ